MDPVVAERLVANEERFREINEKLRADLRELATEEELISFVCECSNASCREGIGLRVGEYEALRSDETHFAVAQGHDRPEIERIVGRTDRYLVVEKLG